MKTRIKTHSYPGDVSKQEKEAMLEGRSTRLKRETTKKYKKNYLLVRERAVLKERTKKRIEEGLKAP